MIRLRCPACQKQLTVPDDKIGKRGNCPSCGGVVFVSHNAAPDGDGLEPSVPATPSSLASPVTPSPATQPASINAIGKAKSRVTVFLLFILIGVIGLIIGGYGVSKQRDALQKVAKEVAEARPKHWSESEKEWTQRMAELTERTQHKYEAEAASYSQYIYLGSSFLGISILFFTIYAAVEAAITTTSYK